MTTKPKYFKNPDRGRSTPFQPYVPQYQLWGITPTPAATGEIAGSQGSAETRTKKSLPFAAYVLPKNSRPKSGMDEEQNGKYPVTQNMPYAEEGQVPMNNMSLPNVGNNVENTWSGMDDVIVDESGSFTKVDENQPMIDNNSEDTNNWNFIPKVMKSAPQPVVEAMKEDDAITVFDATQLNIAYNEYVLAVKGEIISTGPVEQIQEEVRALVFNEHPLSEENVISTDDIIVLKRIKIKVGVFIE